MPTIRSGIVGLIRYLAGLVSLARSLTWNPSYACMSLSQTSLLCLQHTGFDGPDIRAFLPVLRFLYILTR